MTEAQMPRLVFPAPILPSNSAALRARPGLRCHPELPAMRPASTRMLLAITAHSLLQLLRRRLGGSSAPQDPARRQGALEQPLPLGWAGWYFIPRQTPSF